MTSDFFQRLEPRMLLSAGALDPSFGDRGIQVVSATRFVRSDAIAAALQTDGKAVLLGTADNGPIVARLMKSGHPDRWFGTENGITRISFPGVNSFQPTAIALGGGRIIVGGDLDLTDRSLRFGLVGLRADGSIDTSFGKRGFVIGDSSDEESLSALLVTPDGKIVLGGTNASPQVGERMDFVLARLNANGSVDQSFGNKGHVLTTFQTNPTQVQGGISALGAAPGGKIVAAGQSDNALNLARYNSDGTLDTSFNRTGKFGLRAYSPQCRDCSERWRDLRDRRRARFQLGATAKSINRVRGDAARKAGSDVRRSWRRPVAHSLDTPCGFAGRGNGNRSAARR